MDLLLCSAAISNHNNIVNLLIENGADVNAKDNDRQETTLHEMAHQGKLEIAKILLESGASLIRRAKKGNDAMESSLESKRTEVFKTILAFQH